MADDMLFSLSPKSNPKSVYSLLCFVSGSPSSSSSSPNFPNCSFSRESASVFFADYLRSHFSIFQAISPSFIEPHVLRTLACPFAHPFSPTEFLAAASNLSSSTATCPDKVAYPMLKHLSRSGMDFLLHTFNLSWTSHSFPSIWKTSFIIPIHNMGKSLDSPASFWPISLSSTAYQSFLNAS